MVGQDHIKLTLQNAITAGRISHAYIFSGPRGTGKTSAARILAKSLNCVSGPTLTPCQTCPLCQRITAGVSVDVVEIDAASNTGVDNIRSLNDQVQFAPVECRYKVIIIDEAHMLSSGAFNALLKTLEEPPANTIFILATTEPHKIPATIHSRCQQLHFRRLRIPEIVQQLQWISKQETVTVSEGALRIIAQNSDGCMRDAVALLDQIVSFEGGQIEATHVQAILGATDQVQLMAFVGGLVAADMETSVSKYRQMVLDGLSIAQLVRDLSTMVRDLIFLRLGITDQIETDPELLASIPNPDIGTLKFWLETIAKVEQESKGLPNPEAYFQVKLMTAIYDLQSVGFTPQPAAQPKPQAPVAAPAPVAPVASAPPTQRPASAPTTVVPPAPALPTPISGSISQNWQQVLTAIKGKRPSLFTILQQSSVKEMGQQQIQIQLQQNFPFFTEKLKEPQNKNAIEAACAELGFSGIQVVFAAAAVPEKPTPAPLQSGLMPEGVAPVPAPTPPTQPAQPVAVAIGQKDRSINEIVAMFDGTIL